MSHMRSSPLSPILDLDRIPNSESEVETIRRRYIATVKSCMVMLQKPSEFTTYAGG